MPEDQTRSGANPDLVNTWQGQAQEPQGTTADDSIDKGIDTENDDDLGTGADVVGIDGTVLSDDGSPDGQTIADDDDDDDNSEAEDDPQANLEEQQAT